MDLAKKRLGYMLATLILLGIEVCIALFVRDKFIRPYVGDMLVVVLIYTFLRIIFLERPRLLPIYVFAFSTMVELMQAINIVGLLGLQDNRFFRILVGTTFDVKDIVCYGVGCALCGLWEIRLWKCRKKLCEMK